MASRLLSFSNFQEYRTVVGSLLCNDISSELISFILFIGQITQADASSGGPPLLEFIGKVDAFPLSTNTSANARVEVIYFHLLQVIRITFWDDC